MFRAASSKKSPPSSAVPSGQAGINPRLDAVVRKHIERPWLQPMHPPSESAFRKVSGLAGEESGSRPLILDSGCGRGESTRVIAKAHPDALVFGIDRSQKRLENTGWKKFPVREENIIWVRSELETFWRMAQQRAWKLEGHYLLYPNPYPKASQLQRRWHAHPVFPSLVKLGGALELRCNWPIYAREFVRAFGLIDGMELEVEDWCPETPITAFERKYAHSGHQLYRVVIPKLAMARAGLLLTRNL